MFPRSCLFVCFWMRVWCILMEIGISKQEILQEYVFQDLSQVEKLHDTILWL